MSTKYYSIHLENEDTVLYSISGVFDIDQISDLVNDMKKLIPNDTAVPTVQTTEETKGGEHNED